MSFRRHTLVLLLDVGVLLLGITGIRSLDLKASLPVAIEVQEGRLVVTDVLDSTAAGPLRHGDALVALDDHTLHTTDEVEFLMDARPVGSRVTATVERTTYRLDAEIRAVRFYGDFYIAIVALVSLLFFVVGIFVFLKRPQDTAAWIYHLGSLGGVILLANTTTCFPPEPGWLDYLSRTAFYCSYSFVPAIFFHFATMFPHRRWRARSWRYGALYAVVIILGT